jgi:cytochrome c oxidase subunit 4
MTDTAVSQTSAHHDDEFVDHGPTNLGFIKVAIFLAVLTAIEVSWSYLGWSESLHTVEVLGLVFMMMIKFVVVAAYFMHLKFDKKILTWLFYGGFVLAIGVYTAALTTFQIWSRHKGYAP